MEENHLQTAIGGQPAPLMRTSRRTFLQRSLTPVAALSLSGVGSSDGAAAQPIVDSHQHFWDRAALRLPAPPPQEAVLAGPFLPAHLRREIEKVGVARTVLVQGYPQTLDGNRWIFQQANATDYVAGVVAWIDLENPSKAGAALDELCKERKFVGIRHIVEAESDADWIVRGPVIESLRELARRDVRFDMLAKPHHLKNVLTVIEKAPNLRMVINHIAKPDIARGGSPGWAEHMAAIAQHRLVYCKLSGMITEAKRGAWKPSDLKRYVHRVLEVFGWDRVMYGSDWPVCLLAGSYSQVWGALRDVLGEITFEQRDQVYSINATRFYGLTARSR
jgi:L-fuconolactonase